MPRIAYWCSSFRPDIEAVAAEVACLRAAFPKNVAWGVSQRDRLRLSWRNGFCIRPGMQTLFRAATWLAQRAFDINHLYGSLGDWFHLRALRQHPAILTMAVPASPCPPAMLEKIDRFVAEWPSGRDALARVGIEPDKIRLIFPPVDLKRFRPGPPLGPPFRALFATSPDQAAWLESRGVHLILEAARLRPDIRFRLVWRPWGDSLSRLKRWLDDCRLSNVELVVGRIRNMQWHYQQSHVTLAPFTRSDQGKAMPNSLLESLACGRAVIVTDQVGLAPFVEEGGAGIVCSPSGEALAAALDAIQADWPVYSRRARALAEQRFGVETFLRSYARLYEELLSPGLRVEKT
jgi:glycosyltransferase involved in cell wall biosynthesis